MLDTKLWITYWGQREIDYSLSSNINIKSIKWGQQSHKLKEMVLQATSCRTTCSTSFQRTLFLKEVVRSSRIDRMKGLEERTMKTFLNRQTKYSRKSPALHVAWEQGSVIYALLVTENGTRLDMWAELLQLWLSMFSMFNIYVYISVHIVTLHCFGELKEHLPQKSYRQ